MATYYCNPNAQFHGDGTAPTDAASAGAAGAYKTWSGVTLTANNTYLTKRGTTHVGASIRPQSQSSAATTPLTIGAYYNDSGSDDTSNSKEN